MRKKELAALPVMKHRHRAGNVLCVRANGDTLVIDGYHDGEYRGRYCLRECGEYMALVGDIWMQRKLVDMMEGRTYSYWRSASKEPICDTEEQKALAMAFLDKSDAFGYRSVKDRIDYMERHYMTTKRERAWQRKIDRVNARMAQVPVLPDGFDDWCKTTIFKDQQYMFPTGNPDEYACTACGKRHKAKGAKNNRPWVCSRTGQAVVVSKSPSVRWKKDRAMVLQWMTTGERVARHFIVHSFWSKDGQRIKAAEEVRYILKVDGCNEWYYGQYGEADEFEQDWWDSNPRGKRTAKEFCYPDGVREILTGTVYEHLGIPEMAAAGWRVWFNQLMISPRYCHHYEYLVKGGYRRLAEEASSWPMGHLDYKGRTVTEVLGIDKQRVLRLRQANGGLTYLYWMKWERKKGKKVSETAVRWMDENNVSPEAIKFILDRMTPVQVANYLERQRQISGKSASWLLDEWKDLLSMAGQLKMDVTDAIVYRNRDLVGFHDALVVKINRLDAKKQAAEYEKKYPGITQAIAGLKKYEWTDGAYAVIAPSEVADILAEGRSLNHCVTNDRYFERMAKEQSYILFLRRADKLDVPWYTLEVEPGGVIRQKRTHWNRQEKDLEPAKAFLHRWQQEIVKRVGERERALQATAAAERKKELAQLRRDGVVVHGGEMDGTLLADVLLADLMEIAG